MEGSSTLHRYFTIHYLICIIIVGAFHICVLCRCEISHETNIDFLISYNLQLILRREGQLLASNPGSSRIPYKNPRALSIYTIHRGRNFRCKYSMLQLFQTQNRKIRKCISINWKLQKEKEKCID